MKTEQIVYYFDINTHDSHVSRFNIYYCMQHDSNKDEI